MRLLGVLILACVPVLAVTSTGCSKKDDGKKDTAANKDNTGPAKEKTNAEKIVGKWEVTKGDAAPPGLLMDFTKDGKMKVSMKAGEKEMTMDGTYKIDGDKVTTTGKEPGGKESTNTMTIKTLNDTTLVFEQKQGARTEMMELTRK